MSAKLSIIKEPHPQPLPASGEGRQSVALAGWGSFLFLIRLFYSFARFTRSQSPTGNVFIESPTQFLTGGRASNQAFPCRA